MSLPKTGSTLSDVNSAAILRDIYGRGAGKKIARRFDVSIDTAKLWLAGRFPQHRTMELRAAVEAELARIEARNTEIRQQLGLEGRRGGGASGDKESGRAGVGLLSTVGEEAIGLRGEVTA